PGRPPPRPLPLPYTTLFRSPAEKRRDAGEGAQDQGEAHQDFTPDHQRREPRVVAAVQQELDEAPVPVKGDGCRRLHLHGPGPVPDRKSTRLNSSHVKISYAV